MTYRPPTVPLKVIKRIRVSLLSKTRRWPDPSPEDVRDLWATMASRFNARILDKNNSVEMALAADAAEKLGFVDRERFLHDFVTTVGDKIYAPFTPGIPTGPWDLWQQAMVIGHECHHLIQDRKQEGILFEYQYASNSTKRAYYEMEAYRVQMTLTWVFRSEELNPAGMAALLGDYGCDAADISMVGKMLKLSLVSVKEGAVPSEACRFETDWLKARWS